MDVQKAQVLAKEKYLATPFLMSSDRLLYRDLILSIKNDYAKQQKKYPKTLTEIYELMVALYPTRPTVVSRGRNEGMNFGNVAVEPGTQGGR